MKVSTSFDIEPEVWKRVKIAAVERQTTVSAMIEQALTDIITRQRAGGIFIEEGPQLLAFQLKTLFTANRTDLVLKLAQAFLDLGLGDPERLKKYAKGAKEGWKHPNRTGKEVEAISYLLELSKSLRYPGV